MTARPKPPRKAKTVRVKVRESDVDAMAEIIQSLMQRGGGDAELLADLFGEGRRERARDRHIFAYATMLAGMLDDLRVSANGGDTNAGRLLARARAVLDAEIAKGGVEPGILLIIARTFASAGLDPGAALQDAMDAAMRALPAEDQAPDPAALTEHLQELAAAFDNDPFALHMEIAETAAAFPPAHRGAFIRALAESDVAVAREAAVGFVLAAEEATADACVQALVQAGDGKPASAATISRLIRMRPWLPVSRRDAVDAAIKALRPKAEAPVAGERADVQSMYASLGDGAGACGLFAVVKRRRRFVLCSLLTKTEVGVCDAFESDELSRREVDGLIERMASEGGAHEVSHAFFERRLAHALAANVAAATPPPFGMIQIAETLSLGQIHPLAIDTAALIDELLADLPPRRKDADAAAGAHVASTMWPAQVDTVATWFEAGEEVERLLAPLRTRALRVGAVLDRLLPARRGFWAARCAWAAATLKDGTDDVDMFGALWSEFALVARDLAGDKPAGSIPLLRRIAAETVRAYEDRSRG